MLVGWVVALVVVFIVVALVAPTRMGRRKSGEGIVARHSRADAPRLPSEWSWQNIRTRDSELYYEWFGVRIASGDYASPVFDQHMSNWCGCCYLISTIQMLQDRMHIVLGIMDPDMQMFPCFQFNMQLALDTYNAHERNMREDDWNACIGGMPSRVLNSIRAGRCLLRLSGDKGIWMGHPLALDSVPSDGESNIALDELESLEMAAESIMKRILKYGPVVLGINSLCLRDPTLSQRHGMIDTNVLAPRDHAVSVIGWKRVRGKLCWILRNSWGTRFVPSERPDPSCVGNDFNTCTVSKNAWTGDPSNPGYAYVPMDYDGLKGYPSPWYDAIPSKLQALVPRSSDERHDVLTNLAAHGHYSAIQVGMTPR